MSKQAHPFNVILSAKQMNQLSELATRSNCSQAQIIRFALNGAWQMAFNQTPICADGSRCFVPQMHQLSPAQTPHPNIQATEGDAP